MKINPLIFFLIIQRAFGENKFLFFHNSQEFTFKDTCYEAICKKEMEIYKKHNENDDIPPISPVPLNLSCFCPNSFKVDNFHSLTLSFEKLGEFCQQVQEKMKKEEFEAMLFHRLSMEASDELWEISQLLGKERVLLLHERFSSHKAQTQERLNQGKRLQAREAEFIKTHPILKAKILFFFDGIEKAFAVLRDVNEKIGKIPLFGKAWKLGLGDMVISQVTSIAQNMNGLIQGELGVFDAMKNIAMDKVQSVMERTQAAIDLAEEL